ncbi:MAG: nicotinate-nucleotide adenylyltransferase [Clostridiaceae bacterium]
MKIGIVGGTFNPIHNGHLYMAFEAKESLQLDQMIIIPNYIPPHKDSDERNPEDVHQMLNLVFGGIDGFSVSTYELDKKGFSYTYETLEYFTKMNPDDEFYFIIGEDSYVDFSAWKNPERILELAKLVVFERKFYDEDKLIKAREFIKRTGHQEIFLNSLVLEISSRDIRDRVRKGKEIGFLVPREVKEYIIGKGLYRK